MRFGRRPAVPTELSRQIDEALIALDEAQAELARSTTGQQPLDRRRAAHTRVRRALDGADVLLRQATAQAKTHSYREWAHWRHRLSRLSTVRQLHLLAEHDDLGLLPLGSTRAIDTGMSGPAIGDLLHGRSKAPGAPATYGLDLEALLAAPRQVPLTAPLQQTPCAEPVEPLEPAAVVTLSTPPTVAPSAAA